MMRTFHRLTGRAMLFWICGSLPGLAGTSVILGNRSGGDVVLTRAGSKPSCALVVEDRGKEPGGCQQLLPRPAGPREALLESTLAEEFNSEPKPWSPQAWKYHYLLRDGESVTLRFESSGQDEQAELVLFNTTEKSGLALKGILFFTVRYQASGPAGASGPEADLVPCKGPTPPIADAGCNRELNPVSPQEVWLERESRRSLAQPPALTEELPDLF